MEQQVHRGQPGCAVDEFVARGEAVAQVIALDWRHRLGAAGGVLVRDQEEAACAAGRVDDGVGDRRADDVDDRLDQRAGCEVLAGARALVRICGRLCR